MEANSETTLSDSPGQGLNKQEKRAQGEFINKLPARACRLSKWITPPGEEYLTKAALLSTTTEAILSG